MKSVQLALALDPNDSPLSMEKQLTVALAKAVSRKVRILSSTLVGWPVLAMKVEDTGGYLLFDETGEMETSFTKTVLENYQHYLDSFSKISSPEEFLNSLRNISWSEPRGRETLTFKWMISEDITAYLKYPSVNLPILLLNRKIDENIISLEIEEWKKMQTIISDEINRIDDYVRSFYAISESFIGKVAQERRKIELNYDQEITKVRQEMEKVLKEKKAQGYDEVKKRVTEFYPRVAELYGVIAKTKLDLEAGTISERQVSSLESARDKLLKEMDQQAEKALEPFKTEIRSFRQRIESLEQKKKEELASIDSKLDELRKATDEVRSSLESVKRIKSKEMDELTNLARRTVFIDDKLEVILPFLVVKDEKGFTQVISTLKYSGRNKSLFGITAFGSKLENLASPLTNTKFNLPQISLPDNLRKFRDDITKGVEWLEEEGWRVRKLFEDYYFVNF
ncbi:hypothetical protein GWK48_08825 [Metallosphaera tengchongensis]|uniref:Uncharacterized protein n=1 Tax=Metallosphaera tengchongensis TaxID=1532350 RepID=A0A6N0NUQ4_9CREN|nr:hypothetical protein [Metallosphaera tengchongensis]QKR00462.1 hypothetical protein GWK48_08825 [Metallosphaera tengchongensis]